MLHLFGQVPSPLISRVFSGAYVANVKRRCIRILQEQIINALRRAVRGAEIG